MLVRYIHTIELETTANSLENNLYSAKGTNAVRHIGAHTDVSGTLNGSERPRKRFTVEITTARLRSIYDTNIELQGNLVRGKRSEFPALSSCYEV